LNDCRCIPRLQGLIRLSREALLAIARVRQLMKPWPLLVGSLLACLCWLVEAAMLQGLYSAMGSNIDLGQAAVILTATSLGGGAVAAAGRPRHQ
jgi:hypothetical protein